MDLDSLPVRDGFRLRGENISRLEVFVDAAFAFALTLIVIAVGSVPSSLPELIQALHRVPTFAACFTFLAIFWTAHDRWSRRFGLETPRATVLSLAFVFAMLIYVYPLRMVISGGLHFMSGGWVPSEMRLESVEELCACFLIYGAGFTVLSLIVVLLQRHALSRTTELRLTALEILKTRREAGTFGIFVIVGGFSMLLAVLLRHTSTPILASVPGFAYGLVPVFQTVFHARMDRLERALPSHAATQA